MVRITLRLMAISFILSGVVGLCLDHSWAGSMLQQTASIVFSVPFVNEGKSRFTTSVVMILDGS